MDRSTIVAEAAAVTGLALALTSGGGTAAAAVTAGAAADEQTGRGMGALLNTYRY